MTKAEILKKEILRQYRSVRQFAMEMNIPYSTLVTALERGIEGMAYGTVIKMCDKLSLNPVDFSSLERDASLGAQLLENRVMQNYVKLNQTGRDKILELERYNSRAANVVASGDLQKLGPDGAKGVPVEIRAPYLVYENAVREVAKAKVRVLDLCCGNGLHSVETAAAGGTLTVSDIAPQNVALAISRCARSGFPVRGVVADAERLPFEAQSFDVVTCAGSLSYVDLQIFLSEVCRVLAPNGTFICVDSLNHNPVYRINRRIHYWRGQRSKSVILRTPTISTINALSATFPKNVLISYHGIFSFLAPVLRPLFGPLRTAHILDALDKKCPLFERFSFKFVFRGTLP